MSSADLVALPTTAGCINCHRLWQELCEEKRRRKEVEQELEYWRAGLLKPPRWCVAPADWNGYDFALD